MTELITEKALFTISPEAEALQILLMQGKMLTQITV